MFELNFDYYYVNGSKSLMLKLQKNIIDANIIMLKPIILNKTDRISYNYLEI